MVSNCWVQKNESNLQLYPNPFNPATQINYTLPQPSHVILSIFNLQGQLIRTLVNQYQQAGVMKTEWDGRADDFKKVASGIYLYRLQTATFTATRKMTLIQ